MPPLKNANEGLKMTAEEVAKGIVKRETISAPDVAIREQVRARHVAFLLEMHGRNAHWTGHECLECPQMWGTTFGFQIARSSAQVSVHSGNYDSEHQYALSEAIPEESS
jgi:hypothetical protein